MSAFLLLAWLAAADPAQLSPDQSRAFRAWMVRIVDQQIARGPHPRWHQRDCAGLVRFAVQEAFRPHDPQWRRVHGISGRVPPEVALRAHQQELRQGFRRLDGRREAYVGALELVQENTTFVSKDLNLAEPGDLLFFDQGDDQHLMVWTGRYIAYHTGSNQDRDASAGRLHSAGAPQPTDDGLRAVSVPQLMAWRDTRWQPVTRNPNFKGVFRLRFLSR